MRRTWIVAMGVLFAAILAARVSPQNRVAHAQDVRPAGVQPAGSLAQNSRPLHIEDANSSIVKATVSGPEFHALTLFVGVEDPLDPAAKRLRQEYRLDDVVSGETSEFRKMLKLRHWVHSRWHIDNDQNFNGDVFAILEKAKAGAGFNCTHAMKVQHAVMTAMGFVVRDLGVQCNTEEFPDGYHHGVNEVWSNEFSKWVLLDGEYDFHFERDGRVLSALEVHEAVRSDRGRGIVKVQGPDRNVVPMNGLGFPFTSAIGYWWTSYHVRQDTFTEPSGNESRLVIFDNEAFRQTTWYRKRGDHVLRKHWAYDAKAFIPTRDRHQIEWTPGVPDLRVRQTAPAELEVRIANVTPNLKITSVRTDGGDWQTLNDGHLTWKLRDGHNFLEVRTRNVLDVDGPTVMAAVTLQRMEN
ncbi:MAG: hypothetical protein HY000_19435 [Planctomycetes bacterium]|nr:hypothetical protein [Planctomycetota bacterium]